MKNGHTFEEINHFKKVVLIAEAGWKFVLTHSMNTFALSGRYQQLVLHGRLIYTGQQSTISKRWC
jgi:hypothetical protein